MTLNGHFALKSVLGSASDELACPGFRTKLLEYLQSYTRTLSGKKCTAGTLVSGDISFMGLFAGIH